MDRGRHSPEWEEQYRDVLDDNPDPSEEDNKDYNREITRERVDTSPYKPFEEYADPEWDETGKDPEWTDTGKDEEWPETGRDYEWPETGKDEEWPDVDIYEEKYKEEEVNQELAAVRNRSRKK